MNNKIIKLATTIVKQPKSIKWEGILKLAAIIGIVIIAFTLIYQFNFKDKNYCLGFCQIEFHP